MTPPSPDADTIRSTDGSPGPDAKPNSDANGGAPAEAEESGGESAGTVIVAGLVNLGIALAKLVGGLISHSSAMLSEAAHSVADTVTEVFLFVALKRGEKPPDEKHPFGYGRETYFWAFIASLTTFLVGAGFSFFQGITTIIERKPEGDPMISYIVLAVSFVLEGISFLKAVRQVRGQHGSGGQARRVPVADDGHDRQGGHLRGRRGARGPRPRRPGPLPRGDDRRSLWDGLAAIAIGLLLLVVAFVLARANKSLLIGQSASPMIEAELKAEIAAMQHVDGVPLLLTSVIGPGKMVVAAKVDFDDNSTADDVEQTADEAERRLVARH